MDEDARNYAVELQILRALWEMKFRNDASQAICIRGTDLLASKSIDMLQKAPGEELAIIWVHGMAGTGKSTIANTVAADMKSKGDAVVHVSFEGDRPRRGTVISTLATHLAHSDYEIRSEICAAVRARPGVIDGALEDQLKYLVLDPLKNVAQKLTNPVFIIMDALDQYGDMIERRKMLSLISTNFTELPPQFRFLITSRREPDIEHAFSQNPKIKALSLEHVEPGDRLEHIRIYVTHEMSHIRALHRLNSTWPGNENIEMMVLKSEGLFIWASRLVEFVMQSTYPQQSLESILTSQESYKILGFDAFYEAILTTRKGWMAGLAPRFQSIACVALFNHTPAGLTDHEIDVLLDLSEHDSCQFLLRSFCSLFEYLPGNPIRPLHSSLREYLVQNSNNDAPWSLHNTDPHQCLTICCLRVMKKYFRCQGAEGVVDPTSAMKYASRNWFHHLSKAPFPDETIEAELKSFMKEDVFNWAQREVSTEDGRAVIIQFRDIKLDEVSMAFVSHWFVSYCRSIKNVEPLAQIQGLQRLLCSEFSNGTIHIVLALMSAYRFYIQNSWKTVMFSSRSFEGKFFNTLKWLFDQETYHIALPCFPLIRHISPQVYR